MANKEFQEKTKPCPLCGTMLLYEKWLKVVGVYEEQQKHRKQLESELIRTKGQENKLKEEYIKVRQKEKEIRNQYKIELKKQAEVQKEKFQKKFEKDHERINKKLEKQKQADLKRAINEGMIAGINKQKSRMEKVTEMAEKALKKRDKAMERVKQLEEMRRKGTTPQIEGFNFEHELAEQLKNKFPEDEIEPTGHEKGDIIQTVKVEDKKIGKIIYECKKTKEFKNIFIEQIRKDKNRVIADYGIIVTWATKENNQNFWIDGDIIVVDPYGVLDIAIFLRETLLQMYSLKLSKTEFENKGRAIIGFMQSEEFRTQIQNSIAKSREAYEFLKKEITTHVNVWHKRAEIYESIHKSTNIIQNTIKYILLRGRVPENLPKIEELPPLQISSPQKQKEGKEDKKIDIEDLPF